MEILLVRHGETEWNRELLFRGRRDIPLSRHGSAQAEMLATRMHALKPDSIFSSPLSRAVMTAQAAASALGLPVRVEDDLADVDFGIWSGLSRDEVEARYPQDFKKWRDDPLAMRFEGGETVSEVQERGLRWLRRVSGSGSGRIAAVTHRVVLKLLAAAVLDAPGAFWRVRFDTCSVSAVRASAGGFELMYLNDTHHLAACRDAKPPPDF
jgi:probable phosphoglycerate mutase